jgi:methionyl-tRNA formyltransferase
VLKCDAGPLIDQVQIPLAGDEQAPELTGRLFKLGSGLLLKNLRAILSGAAAMAARPQDEARATHAAKVAPEEARLDPGVLPAEKLHGRVRGLAGWPGTYLELLLADLQTGEKRAPLRVEPHMRGEERGARRRECDL